MLGTFDLRLLIIRSVKAVRRDGVAHTLRTAFSHFRPERAEDEFDRKYGTDTAGIVPLWRFRIRSPNARFGWRYQTSSAVELEQYLKCIPHDPRDFTFVDLGCGKGRMLIAAGKLGFHRVVGVEFVAELATIAKNNLTRTGTTNAVVINEDAAEFCFPHERFCALHVQPLLGRSDAEGAGKSATSAAGQGIHHLQQCQMRSASGLVRFLATVRVGRGDTIPDDHLGNQP